MAPPRPGPVTLQSADPLGVRLEFQSAALYELVARLGVRSYDDLLAGHWTMPDYSRGIERFDPARFDRREIYARSTRHRRTTVLIVNAPAGGKGIASEDRPAASPRGAVACRTEPLAESSALGRVLRRARAWLRRLLDR